MNSCVIFLALMGIVCLVESRPPAAPLPPCDSSNLGLTMTSPMTLSSVSVLTSTSTYSTDTKITVTIQAKHGETFKDFKVLAVPANVENDGTKRYGTFVDFPKSARLDCDKEVLTQTDLGVAQNSVTFTWMAPSAFDNEKLPALDLKFRVLISHQDKTLWMPFESGVIRYQQSVCETEKNCFRSPENCADDDCDVMVGWKLDGDYVKFGVTGIVTVTDHYLAIGFSLTGVMSPSPTVDCVRDKTTSNVEVKSGTNQERNNRFLSPPHLGLGEARSGEYVDGRITCHFSYVRSKSSVKGNSSTVNDKDFLADLTNNKYYLLAAVGPTNDEGNPTYHGITKVVNPKLVNFTETSSDSLSAEPQVKHKKSRQAKQSVCEIEENCFRSPENCAGKDCDMMVGWKLEGNYVKFTAQGIVTVTDHYLAIGFSSAGTMSPSPTVDCIRDKATSTVDIKSGFNEERNNRFLSPPSLGLGDIKSGEYVDGRITCHFSYVKSRGLLGISKKASPLDDKDLVADLENNKYYLIVAVGPVNDEGALTYHGVTKVVNPKAVDFTKMPVRGEVST